MKLGGVGERGGGEALGIKGRLESGERGACGKGEKESAEGEREMGWLKEKRCSFS